MKRLSKEEFIEKAKQIHGDNYDYSKVEYVNNRTKVCIICPEHGEFWQTPSSHLNGRGCKFCGIKLTSKKNNDTRETFIEKAKQVHGSKYNYSKVEYVNSQTKVCIICPEHGEFWQRPNDHLTGYGCFKCGHNTAKIKNSWIFDKFVEQAKKVHGNKYDYSKVNYTNAHTKICIICPEHGEFWQMPYSHLQGIGCPSCNNSKLEQEVSDCLNENNIEFVREKTFSWLKRKSLDFYLPKQNIAIECQGGQHFKPVNFFGGKSSLDKQIDRDREKLIECKHNGVDVMYYFHDSKFFNTYDNEAHTIDELCEKINSY